MTGTDLETATGVTPMVAVRGVHKFFGDLHVLRGIDLDIAAGEVCVILGPSGSGKSTLLRCLNMLEDISAGRVYVDGHLLGYRVDSKGVLHERRDRVIAAQRSHIGMVFQRFNLFPHMTALENVMEAPVQVLKRSKKEARAQALELLDRVGLADRADHYPAELSGGQQQRVAIARALATNPELLLLDEITAALDPVLVGEVLDLVREIKAQGSTILMATHEISFARQAADCVVFLKDGQIVEQGPPEQVIDDPREQATRDFLARILR